MTIDGDPHSYLDELSVELAPEAERIWGACSGAPDPASGRALKAYLLHNQIHTGLFFSAHPDATVTDVRDSLRERDRAVALGIRAQGMDPASLQQAFRQEFGV